MKRPSGRRIYVLTESPIPKVFPAPRLSLGLIAGSVFCAVAWAQAPVITGQPSAQRVTEGLTAVFSVAASGDSLAFQWQKNGADITSANSAAYFIPTAATADDGSGFRCIVSNAHGADTSSAAMLSVEAGGYAGWSHTALLSIRTTADWAALPDTLVLHDFPLLVRLDSEMFDFSQAKPNGSDIRFATTDSVPLAHQIDSWNATDGRAAVWVKLDSLAGNAASTIRIFWGNPDASDASNGAALFDAREGYSGVWHLQESADASPGRFRDATANVRHGTGVGLTSASTVPGIIGNTQMFSTQDSTYISLGNLEVSRGAAYTISMWVKGAGNQNDMRLFAEPGNGNGSLFTFGTGNTTQFSKLDLYLRGRNAIPVVDHAKSQADAFDDTWHHVALVQNQGTFTFFVDGQPSGSGNFAYDTLFSPVRSILGAIVRSSSSYHFTGLIDEVWISHTARSAGYMQAIYLNQKADQVMVGSPSPDGCTKEFGVAKDTVQVGELDSVSVTGIAACALQTRWTRIAAGSEEVPLPATGLTATFKAGRISADSSVTLRFSALYGEEWQSQDVLVQILDNVPNPEFTLTAPGTWNGRDSLKLQPEITNLAAIQASLAPALRYIWSRGGITVDAREDANSMTLLQASQTGQAFVRLCLDNGSVPACETVTIEVTVPNGIRLLDLSKNPVEFSGGFVAWNLPAQVEIWSLDGKVLFDRIGRPGMKFQLSRGLQESLHRGQHRMKITPIE